MDEKKQGVLFAKNRGFSAANSDIIGRIDADTLLPVRWVVGLQLSGAETKALRMGHGQLRGAYVNALKDELWLVGAQVTSTKGVPIAEDDQIRSRKILAKRKEIDKLVAARQAGNTIVPLELLTRGRYIKLRIAVGRGKKRYDKRETIKQRQQEREASRLAR